MKRAIIWDLDGTLFDSYDMIVGSIYTVFQELDIPVSTEDIRRHALQFSIKSLFQIVSERYNVSVDFLNRRYGEISRGRYLDIKAMPNALNVLEQLRLRGIANYVFTHRGKTTIPVLENLGMSNYFAEIITSQSGFPRKPDPEALLYFIDKYALEPACSYYVGDRKLDMECAANAGIHGILYVSENSVPNLCGTELAVIENLMDILNVI